MEKYNDVDLLVLGSGESLGKNSLAALAGFVLKAPGVRGIIGCVNVGLG